MPSEGAESVPSEGFSQGKRRKVTMTVLGRRTQHATILGGAAIILAVSGGAPATAQINSRDVPIATQPQQRRVPAGSCFTVKKDNKNSMSSQKSFQTYTLRWFVLNEQFKRRRQSFIISGN